MVAEISEMVVSLNGLIGVCLDGAEGFEEVAKNVQDDELKKLMEACAVQRLAFAKDLQSQVTQLGGIPTTSGSPVGAAHRGWIGIKSIVTGGDRDAILAECLTGEDYTIQFYEDALKKELIQGLNFTLNTQLEQIRSVRQSIQTLASTGK